MPTAGGAVPAHTLAIASGRSGVGKTNIATNLGIALAARGHRVCILDADARPANLHALLGYYPRHTLDHLLTDPRSSLDDVLATGPSGVRVLPLASVLADHLSLDPDQQRRLMEAVEDLESRFDFLLVDTAAGVRNTSLQFLAAAQHILLVITPDPKSLSASFAMLQALARQGPVHPVHVLVNMASTPEVGQDVFRRFSATVEKYLRLKVGFLGQIPEDETVISSIELQRPVVLLKHTAPASRGFYELAADLLRIVGNRPPRVRFSAFWRRVPTTAVQEARRAEVTAEYPRPAIPVTVPPANLSRQQILDATLKLIAEPTTRGQDIEELLQPLITAFAERFKRYPVDIKEALLHAIELQDFPSREVRHLVQTLESRFESRYGKPVLSMETLLMRLFAQAKDSSEKIRQLVERLLDYHRSTFGQDAIDAAAETLTRALEGGYPQTELEEIIEGLETAYTRRYGPREDREAAQAGTETLVRLRPLIETVVRQNQALGESLAALAAALPPTGDENEV